MHMKRTLLAASLVLAGAPANAGLGDDLNDFFDSMGFQTNTTPAGIYKSQSAGYYSGGALFAKTPVRNYQLASVQLPHFRAGCGGIDFFAGSFSFIDSDQLVAMMKNIGSNAVGLGFQVALSTISPKLSGLIQNMQQMANDINSLNINSCEAAANALGAVLPKTEATQKALCKSIGTGKGIYSDHAYANQDCGAAGGAQGTLAAGRTDPRFKDLFPEGNMVWNALKKISTTSTDTELAELIMSLTGTVIYPIVGNSDAPVTPQIKNQTILAENDRHMEAFMNGGDITVYKCTDGTNEFECLTVAQQQKNIPADKAYKNRVVKMLDNMIEKLLLGEQLQQAELNMLSETSLPVYKMLNVATAYSPTYANHWKSTYADAIALDLVYQYFRSLTEVLDDAVSLLQLPKDHVEEFKERAHKTRLSLERMRDKKAGQVDRTIAMMQESMMIERMLISAMSPGLASSVQWSKSMQ